MPSIRSRIRARLLAGETMTSEQAMNEYSYCTRPVFFHVIRALEADGHRVERRRSNIDRRQLEFSVTAKPPQEQSLTAPTYSRIERILQRHRLGDLELAP